MLMVRVRRSQLETTCKSQQQHHPSDSSTLQPDYNYHGDDHDDEYDENQDDDHAYDDDYYRECNDDTNSTTHLTLIID